MYSKIVLATALVFMVAGCDTKQKPKLDGKKLIEQKCSRCHNLDLPPKTYADEKAPPMMAVTFHIRDFIKAPNASEKIPKAIAFIKDYVIHPSASKSFCDKQSLKTYGVMPSQKGKVTQDELEAIATYMFEHFTMQNLNDAQNLQNKLNAMPKGERLAMKNNCFSCHKVDKKIVGPAFSTIADKEGNTLSVLMHSIKNGSAKKYASSKGAIMPAFKKINDADVKTIAQWILSLKKQQKNER